MSRGLKELREKATLISGKEYSRKRVQSVQRPCGERVPGLFKQAERPVWLELRQWDVRAGNMGEDVRRYGEQVIRAL